MTPHLPPPEETSRRESVWVVEDSPLEAELARRALATHYDVEIFTEGLPALERLAAGPPPDALLLDAHLPDTTGPELCRAVRERFDEVSLPVVFVTAQRRSEDVVAGLEAGANDYVTKPYRAAELLARVATLVRVGRLHARVKQLERAERDARALAEAANLSKDEFLATTSHELRTPLNAILGWTRMLRAGELAGEERDRALAAVERNARAQAQLIDDLLDISRVVSGKLRLEVGPLDLEAVVREAVESIRPAAEAKGVALDLQAGLGAAVTGDADRLQQVAWNLLSNAVKFTPRGGRVGVRVDCADASARLAVTDSGQGIAPEFLPHVFERFRQADGSSSRRHGGLGLGLALVRSLVELHGGSVEAFSEGEGRGSTFTIGLPARVGREPTGPPAPRPSRGEPAPESPELSRAPRLDGLSVLVVDNEPDARDLVAAALRLHGARVVTAASADEALAALERESPDVLVSDIGMPDTDGYELVRRVRALPAGRGAVRAAALTAYDRGGDRERALAAGFDAHIGKPVEPAVLAAAVARLAGRG